MLRSAHQFPFCAFSDLINLSSESLLVFLYYANLECLFMVTVETPQLLKYGVSRLWSSGVIKGWRKITDSVFLLN